MMMMGYLGGEEFILAYDAVAVFSSDQLIVFPDAVGLDRAVLVILCPSTMHVAVLPFASVVITTLGPGKRP